jgi:cyclopropane-fatty-acyl-phospholipid synthase
MGILKFCGNDVSGGVLVDKAAEVVIGTFFEYAGVKVSESDDGADMIVSDPSFYRDVFAKGSLGLGDSYVAGKWDSRHIDEIIYRVLSRGVYQKLAPVWGIANEIKRRVMNLQSMEGSREVIERHYDLPAEFYAQFLDSHFQYTCGRFEGTDDLEEAQKIKMDNICKKLGLKAGDKVMDVGGGWGGLARFMAEEYGAEPTVVTLSHEQARYIKENHGEKVNVELCDYREIPGSYAGRFDAVTAVGILEHIGHKNYPEFMRVLAENLKKGGRALVHSLYSPTLSTAQNPWVDKHIFPNGEIAPRSSIKDALSVVLDSVEGSAYPSFEDITRHYPLTLHAWKNKLEVARASGKVKMSEQEYRKWIYYFMCFAGAIKAEHVRVGQFLYEKPDVDGLCMG